MAVKPCLRTWPATKFIALLLWALACCLATSAAVAQDLQAVPALTARVIDTTATLDAAQLQALEAKLAAFEKARGSQIVVLMVATTLPEDITDYAQRVGDSWKIGRKGIGDGLLLIVAKNDRKLRIATAKTLEGAIPDLAAKQIIDRAITPRFKQGDFAGGIDAGVEQLMARIKGEELPLPSEDAATSKRGGSGFQLTDLAVFLFFAVPIGAKLLSGIFGRKFGAVATGGAVGVLAWLFTSSLLLAGGAAVIGVLFALFASLASFGGMRGMGGGMSSGSWGGGGGSSSSGGFSSGGGGNFGGGGSSGNW